MNNKLTNYFNEFIKIIALNIAEMMTKYRVCVSDHRTDLWLSCVL